MVILGPPPPAMEQFTEIQESEIQWCLNHI